MNPISCPVVALPPGAAYTYRLGATLQVRKRNLNLVVRRRNRIVHRCDLDPTGTGTVLPLSNADTVDAINTLEGAVTGIDAFV